VVERDVANDDQEYRRQMDAHAARKDVEFVPFLQRKSDGVCRYEDHGDHLVVILAVASLGTLTLTIEPCYDPETQRLWNQGAIMKASLS
jgi:hypothetical protein